MKRFIAAILICVTSACLLDGRMDAQTYTQTPVTVSKEKVRNSDGKVYYSHVVLERQTLYSIAKAYGVTTDEIIKANPELNLVTEGLKKNSILLIPTTGTVEKAESKNNDANTTQTQNQVQEQASTENSAAKEKKKDDGYTIHITRWYENIDDIAYKYSVPKDILMKYNGLTSEKLKNRQKLRIPSVATVAAMSQEESVKTTAETSVKEKPKTEAVAEKDKKQEQEDVEIEELGKLSKVRALVMLPFNASGTPSQGNLDFYSGVLMAVKALSDEGISTDLSVYDVAGGNIQVTTERLRNSDFCIGPVNADGIRKVLGMAPEDTYVISPLDQKTAGFADSTMNFIQAPASQKSQYSDLIKWLKSEKKSGDKVIVISEKGVSNNSVKLMDELLAESGISYSTYQYNILQGRNAANGLSALMTSTGTNRVIINSESEAFVNDAVRNLDVMVYRKSNVILYSPSKIRSFETIDVDNLHNLQTRVSASYYIDYNSPGVKRFLLEYRALYNTEPTQFAFQGYDLAYFFISMKAKYGDAWLNAATRTGAHNMMQTNIKLRKMSDGGYVNEGVRRVVYGSNYSIELVHESDGSFMRNPFQAILSH